MWGQARFVHFSLVQSGDWDKGFQQANTATRHMIRKPYIAFTVMCIYVCHTSFSWIPKQITWMSLTGSLLQTFAWVIYVASPEMHSLCLDLSWMADFSFSWPGLRMWLNSMSFYYSTILRPCHQSWERSILNYVLFYSTLEIWGVLWCMTVFKKYCQKSIFFWYSKKI